MAVWTLIPDRIEDEETRTAARLGVFGATFVTFFLAEMGDKTQIATVAMAAQFSSVLLVVAGTTLGMLIADIPAVFLGQRFAARIPMRLVHGIAAALFALLAHRDAGRLRRAVRPVARPFRAPSRPRSPARAARAARSPASATRASACAAAGHQLAFARHR